MSRATTKTELMEAAEGQYNKMWKLIDSMTQEEREGTLFYGEGFCKPEAHWQRDKNLRDVLAHLYEWHQLLLNWVESNQKGEARPFLPPPYSWKDYGAMNVGFWEKHQATSYENAKEMLAGSHKEVMKLIQSFSDAELFEKKYFTWTGATSVGAYCISVTSSHYDWAMKKIKTYLKACRQTSKQ